MFARQQETPNSKAGVAGSNPAGGTAGGTRLRTSTRISRVLARPSGLSAKRRRVCGRVAPSGVGHDQHLGNDCLIDVRELEQSNFAGAEDGSLRLVAADARPHQHGDGRGVIAPVGDEDAFAERGPSPRVSDRTRRVAIGIGRQGDGRSDRGRCGGGQGLECARRVGGLTRGPRTAGDRRGSSSGDHDRTNPDVHRVPFASGPTRVEYPLTCASIG
ncbi:MAG: hypothetical protein V7643_3209 [Mycobacterium sp.]